MEILAGQIWRFDRKSQEHHVKVTNLGVRAVMVVECSPQGVIADGARRFGVSRRRFGQALGKVPAYLFVK